MFQTSPHSALLPSGTIEDRFSGVGLIRCNEWQSEVKWSCSIQFAAQMRKEFSCLLFKKKSWCCLYDKMLALSGSGQSGGSALAYGSRRQTMI